MTQGDDAKAEHKTAAAHVNDKGVYEETAFGRRRTSRMPKWFATLIWVVGMPILFIYRRLRR